MLSIRNTYAATSIVSFKNSSGGHIVSMTMTYQLDKKEYSPGETINIIQQAGIGHITCSNGTALDRAFEPRLILEMGSPDKSKFLQYLSQTTTNAPIYFNSIDKIIYKNENVYINENQYFGNIKKDIWEYYIGGYQPAQKYLKDRKGRKLSLDEIDQYQRIIKVLSETIKIVDEINF